MIQMFSAPLAEFFVLQFAFYFAHVFASPIVKTFAFGALQPYQIVL